MSEPGHTGDPDRDLLLLELQADVVMALREGNPNIVRMRCERFGRGPEVSELRGLIEHLTGNVEEAVDHFDDAKLDYLHEKRYTEAAIASIKKSRVLKESGNQERFMEAVNDAGSYFAQRVDSLHTTFGLFLHEQSTEYDKLVADIRR